MKFIMNFLRSPFQFRSTDQSTKKSDSASPIVENMFIDPTTGISTDPRWRASSPGMGASSSVPGSPRLQHRVPGFENNGSHPIEVVHKPTMPQNSPSEESEKPQRVRVIPIKVESVDDSSSPKRRPGAFHSSSGTIPRSSQFGPSHPSFEELHNRKRHSSGPTSHKKGEPTESKPKVCNIPIFVQGRDTPVVPKTSPSSQNVPVHIVKTSTPPDAQTTTAKQNGGNLTKCTTKQKQEPKLSNCGVSLKQISDILSELQSLKAGVNEFKGVPQDKQYRYLDEMLTRCMLKLDNVETYGNDEVRASRKAAIRAVEKCITDLESRTQGNAKSEQPADQAEENKGPPELTDTTKEEEMNISQEQTDVDTKKTEEMVTKEGDSETSNDQSATSNKPGCPEETDSSESKPELTETAQIVAEKVECIGLTVATQNAESVAEKHTDGTDVNQNSEDVASKLMDVDVTTTKQLEEPGEKTQVQEDQPADSVEDSKMVVEASSEPMEVEVPSQTFVDLPKQNVPVDSDEVPEANANLYSEVKTADSEMVELSKEAVSSENKDSSISTETSN